MLRANNINILNIATPSYVNNVLYNNNGNLVWNGYYLISSSNSYFINGGNIFGTSAYIGTNDNQNLVFKTNNADRLKIDKSGDITVYKNLNILSLTSSQSDLVIVSSTGSIGRTVSTFFKQYGNSFGTHSYIGTTDNYGISIITNDATALNIGTSGNINIPYYISSSYSLLYTDNNGDVIKDDMFNINIYGNQSIKLLSDGYYLLGGGFSDYKSLPIHRLAKIDINGNLDSVFKDNLSLLFNDINLYVNTISVYNDIIYVGLYNGFPSRTTIGASFIYSFNLDGTQNTSFKINLGSGFLKDDVNTPVNITDIKIQTDGKFLVCGDFNIFNGNTRNRLIRLNSDGSEDTTFYTNLGSGFNNIVNSISIQNDNKILVSGRFTTFNGNTRNRLVRLNSDGTEDISFSNNLGNGFNDVVNITIPKLNGDILVGGGFSNFNGDASSGFIVLNNDGSIYSNNSIFSGGDNITNLTLQSDGKILAGGSFIKKLTRITSDYTRDTSFDYKMTNILTNFSTVPKECILVVNNEYILYNDSNTAAIKKILIDGTPINNIIDKLPFIKQHGNLMNNEDIYIGSINDYKVKIKVNNNVIGNFNQDGLDLYGTMELSGAYSSTPLVIKSTSTYSYTDNYSMYYSTSQHRLYLAKPDVQTGYNLWLFANSDSDAGGIVMKNYNSGQSAGIGIKMTNNENVDIYQQYLGNVNSIYGGNTIFIRNLGTGQMRFITDENKAFVYGTDIYSSDNFMFINATSSRLLVYGSGTTSGSIAQFHDSTKTSNTLIIKNDGLIGVNTATPSYQLDVISATAITARFSGRVIGATAINSNEFVTLGQLSIGSSQSSFSQNGNSFGATAILGTNDNQSLILNTNGVNRMIIGTNGFIGIGTMSPSFALHLVGDSPNITVERYDNSTSGAVYRSSKGRGTPTSPLPIGNGDMSLHIDSWGYDGTTMVRGADIRAVADGTFSSTNRGMYMRFSTTDVNSTTVTERIRINSNGNISIGTTSSLYRLDVISATAISARFDGRVIGVTAVNSNEFATLGQLSTGLSQSYFSQNGNSFGATALFGTNDNQSLVLETNGVNRMTIATYGSIGFGVNIPTHLLDVATSSSIKIRALNHTFSQAKQVYIDNSGVLLIATFSNNPLIITDSTTITALTTIANWDVRGNWLGGLINGYAGQYYRNSDWFFLFYNDGDPMRMMRG